MMEDKGENKTNSHANFVKSLGFGSHMQSRSYRTKRGSKEDRMEGIKEKRKKNGAHAPYKSQSK
jgi:hypothetical protein